MTTHHSADTTTEKRGPGRPPKHHKEDHHKAVVTTDDATAEPTKQPGEVMVTYVPQKDDPVETVWNSHRFVANVARPVKDPQMISQAKSNPWFEVEGHEKSVDESHGAPPKDSDGYRRYAVDWFKATDWYGMKDDQSRPHPNSLEFEERWESEEKLREACGVGSDDLEYLNKLLTPRLAELKKAEG